MCQCMKLTSYEDWSFNSGIDFFRGSYNTQRSGNKAEQVATLCKCTCITRSRYLPAFALWKPISEHLPAVCTASHDEEESSTACVHQFLFPSGENWCWNVRNAASSFQRVLPKLIEDIWVVFPFQKWTPILWRQPPPGRPSTSREVAQDVEIEFGTCQKILTEEMQIPYCFGTT